MVLKHWQELHYLAKVTDNGRESENIKVKNELVWPVSLSSFSSTSLLLNFCSVLPPSPNNVLLIISPWLACLCGWVLCPDPLMGICDAPKSLLKWLTGALRGAARSFDVPRSGETGCTLDYTNLSVAQLHFALWKPWLTGGLVGHLTDLLT